MGNETFQNPSFENVSFGNGNEDSSLNGLPMYVILILKIIKGFLLGGDTNMIQTVDQKKVEIMQNLLRLQLGYDYTADNIAQRQLLSSFPLPNEAFSNEAF